MIPQLEVCTFNISDLKKTIKYNVSRIELCINKDVGGLTPPKKDIEFAVETNMPIHPIIRPRGGDFLYNNQEMKSMINSISFCKNSAIEGIDLINELALKGEKRISIMPGSKLRASNIDRFLDSNLINEYHSSCYINNSFSALELESLIKKIYS